MAIIDVKISCPILKVVIDGQKPPPSGLNQSPRHAWSDGDRNASEDHVFNVGLLHDPPAEYDGWVGYIWAKAI